MRIDVKKFLFFGSKVQKEAFFEKAQELGVIHFIAMGERSKEVSHDVSRLLSAIKVLRGLSPEEQEDVEDYAAADGIAEKILELKRLIDDLAEEARILRLEIERVRIFDDFSLEDIQVIRKEGNRVLQFFYSKQGVYDDSNLPEEMIFVGREHNLDYFVAINSEPRQYDRMVEMLIPEPLGTLQARFAANAKESDAAEQALKPYAKFSQFLHKALVFEMDSYNLKKAKSSVQTEMDGDLFAVEGWVSLNSIDAMYALADQMDVHVEEIAIEEQDAIPTYLENTGVNRIGEDLIDIYDTPAHTDRDPSLWVLLSFALFFGMILGDAGYGLVFLLSALYIRYRTGALQGIGNRMWKLFVILSFATILWGTMSHSFFGMPIGPDNPLRKVSLLHWLETKKADYYLKEKAKTYQQWVKVYPRIAEATSGEQVLQYGKKGESYALAGQLADTILLEIALVVGILHLTLSFLRYIDRNWAGAGWILFMFGCYLYIPSYLKTISMTNYVFGVSVAEAAYSGLILIYLGLGLAFFLGFLKDRIWGLLQAMNLIQVFGDVLSYLRLYALGLAGSVVMATINDFAVTINVVFGVILFIIGHAINMALGIMGGVIHGLRLNFIEWYHYSFEGGGKKFNPLRKLSQNKE